MGGSCTALEECLVSFYGVMGNKETQMKRLMNGWGLFLTAAAVCMFSGLAGAKESEMVETHVVILGTSDIHGNICCWSYEDDAETDYGMARLYTCIQEIRKENRSPFLLTPVMSFRAMS